MKRILYMMVGLMVTSAALSLVSCKGPKLKDADEAYDRGEYFDAATIYRKLYNQYNRKEDQWLRGELAFQLGMCHLKLNQGNRAAAAFQNAIRYEYEDTTLMLRLAQAQQREGQYAAAINSYNEYLDIAPDSWEAKVGIRGCELAPQWKEEGSRYIVKQDKMFNSRRADYCPMYLDKNQEYIYFTSTNEKSTGELRSEITGTKKGDIYFSKKDEKGKWSRPEVVDGGLNTEHDEGAAAFSPDGSTMYLSRAVRQDWPTTVEIYTSSRSEAKWSAPQKFEITADTLSNYSDPFVSPDGNWLYFASDMPGGQGGTDIWRINLKDKHGTLENLGPQINTKGNERFPNVRTDSLLYFSSDGHPGMGGLDLFLATLQPRDENDRTAMDRWVIENMGVPMNSAADDFGLTFGTGESGFFSSNRGDARGYDHIFSFIKPDLQIWISGYVVDKDDEPVPNAVIRIVGDDGSNQKTVAKPDGSFRFDLQRGVKYAMMAGAEGYLNARQEFESDSTEEDAEYNVDFILAAMFKAQIIENIFYDFDKAVLRDESKLALDSMVMLLKDHPNIVIEMASHTDRVGSAKYNQGLSQRRAQSVVDYLIANGIPRERLKPTGYGESRPKTVTKRIHSQYPQFEEGVTLTEEFIKTLSKEDQQAADQVNRRTEFQVIDTTYEY
ncbi:MAG: tetratricopeptide repeat protein [Bacteroidales bacterium]|nr:tetratricopeptide repeat protein [Bacteroidales bacterium]